jgi:hypothetical protein
MLDLVLLEQATERYKKRRKAEVEVESRGRDEREKRTEERRQTTTTKHFVIETDFTKFPPSIAGHKKRAKAD